MIKATTAIIAAAQFVLLISVFQPAFANGGDQRVIENKYLINLSRAPFTPRVGVKTSFSASFVDIQKNKLISEDLIVKIRISKLGEAPKGNFIFEQNNVTVTGGVLDFPYIFTDAGLHEIFFDFAFSSSPQQLYNVPDFLLDVQKSETSQQLNSIWALSAILGIVLGFLAGWSARQKYIIISKK